MQTRKRRYNYRQIYVQISKYGKTIQEMSAHYGTDEKFFLKKIQKGLDNKLYADVLKADERNRKKIKRH